MDYEGNYFPDDEDISPKKAKRKKIIRRCVYVLLAAVYAVVFAVILSNCEPGMYKKPVFSDAANELYKSDPEGFEVYEVYPMTFMNYDGSVQVAGVAYAKTAGELELGIKYNSKLDNEETGFKVRFELTDTNGVIYETANVESADKGRYKYLRISFSGVDLPLDGNVYINGEASAATDGEGQMYKTYEYTLKIYKEGVEEPEEIAVFNNVTPIKLTSFR